jgi:crotonobetainyl-CoA:carnitine CoA-transferase CaiB-like acyl-CoA transferase
MRQRPPADPALQQRSWAALMLAILSLITMMLMSGNVRRGVYVVVVALIVAVTGLWLAISATSRARRGGTGRPRGVVLATILGVVGFLFSAFVLAGFLMFWPQLTQYSNCLSGANTVSAQQACQQQLNNSVGNEIGVLGG